MIDVSLGIWTSSTSRCRRRWFSWGGNSGFGSQTSPCPSEWLTRYTQQFAPLDLKTAWGREKVVYECRWVWMSSQLRTRMRVLLWLRGGLGVKVMWMHSLLISLDVRQLINSGFRLNHQVAMRQDFWESFLLRYEGQKKHMCMCFVYDWTTVESYEDRKKVKTLNLLAPAL